MSNSSHIINAHTKPSDNIRTYYVIITSTLSSFKL